MTDLAPAPQNPALKPPAKTAPFALAVVDAGSFYGRYRVRTSDLLRVKQALYQLS